jgi:hypothetical protein
MSEFKGYRKVKVQKMRPYVDGEDTTGWSISERDMLEVGGMVTTDDEGSIWYVSKSFFEANYELVTENITETTADLKTLHNSNVSVAHKKVKDTRVVGNGDSFQLLFKVSSEDEGWMKSTKAIDVLHGCLVQVTTQQRNPDGSYVVAEALSYVPGVRIIDDINDGRTIVPHLNK